MPRPLNEQVVVIVGASSGIGAATSLELARKGATVVLAARNEIGLRDVAQQVEASGGRAAVVVADVAEWAQVQRLADQTVEQFGRIDTWINNAAVSTYATVEDTTVEEIERVIRVDLLGQIYGVKAVLPHMRRRGEGTIINVASILGERAVPLQAAYVAAKHGVKGFTESLRLELDREKSGIIVTLVMPGSTNTPLFNHARSKLGVKPRPIPPVYQPSVVAEAIAFACEHRRRDIVVTGAGKLLTLTDKWSPGFTDWLMRFGDSSARGQMSDQPDDGADNLFEPMREPAAISGDFGHLAKPISKYTKFLELYPWRKRFLIGLASATSLVLAARAARSLPPAA